MVSNCFARYELNISKKSPHLSGFTTKSNTNKKKSNAIQWKCSASITATQYHFKLWIIGFFKGQLDLSPCFDPLQWDGVVPMWSTITPGCGAFSQVPYVSYVSYVYYVYCVSYVVYYHTWVWGFLTGALNTTSSCQYTPREVWSVYPNSWGYFSKVSSTW